MTILQDATIHRLIVDTVGKKVERGESITPQDWIDFARTVQELTVAVLQRARTLTVTDAQPSPAGQGDDSDLLAELRDVEDYFEDVDPNPIHLATVRAAIEALAARQPVGEVSVRKEDANNYCLILRALDMEEGGDPVAEVQALTVVRDLQLMGENPAWRDELAREAYNRGLADGLSADRQPEASNQVVKNVEQLGVDGQPMGQEPVMYQVRPRSLPAAEGWREVSKRQFDDRGEFPGYPETEWERRTLYAGPPAQAVDLEQFRESVEDLRGWAQNQHDERGDTSMLDVVKECDRLLTLIDEANRG